MAITGTDRGTGTHNTGSTTFVCSPGSTIPVGSAGILVVALDNAATGGTAGNVPSSVTDSVGNVWTRQQNPTYDPAGASAGVETACYVCESLVTQLTSANNVTLNLGSTTTAKAFAFHEATPTDATKKISYVGGAAGTGAGTGSPVFASNPSITSGNMIIGWGGAEQTDTWTGDSDTTNGSWSAQQHAGVGSGTSAMSITTQRKVVTATGTQTYGPTLTSADCILGYIELTEVARLNLVNLESLNRGLNRGINQGVA
jgi:hypothetical protein